jgi:hypothetical protein
MDNGSKFWLAIWAMIGITILGSIAAIGGCVYKTNELAVTTVDKAVEKGVDPMVAKCAMMLGGTSTISANETAICLSVASKK